MAQPGGEGRAGKSRTLRQISVTLGLKGISAIASGNPPVVSSKTINSRMLMQVFHYVGYFCHPVAAGV